MDIMGKPARWLKSVLLGKKSSKSSGSKDKEVTLLQTYGLRFFNMILCIQFVYGVTL